MYRLLLQKTLRFSLGRLAVMIGAVALAMTLLLMFFAGVNAILAPNSHTTWRLAPAVNQNAQNYPGVDPVYMLNGGDTMISELELARQRGYQNAWFANAEEIYGTQLVQAEEFLPGSARKVDEAGHILRTQFLKTGPNAPKFDATHGNLKIPDEGEYYLSQPLDKIRAEQEKLGWKNAEYKALFDSFGTKYLGVLPYSFTSDPESAVVIQAMSEFRKNQVNQIINHPDSITPENENSFPKLIYTLDTAQIEKAMNISGSSNNSQEIIINAFKLAGGLCLVFPIILLLSICSGLGLKQKETRYAALRLVGATKRQITNLVFLETLISMIIGIILGAILFLPCRHFAAQSFTLQQKHFWEPDWIVPLPQLIAIILGVVILGIFVNFRSLRKISISPLGVMRSQSLHKRPGIWRIIPLLVAIAVMLYQSRAVAAKKGDGISDASLLIFLAAFALLLIAQIISGPWFTHNIAKIFSLRANSGITMLATKRLTLLSSQVFRSVSGVMIALFVGSFFMTFVNTVERGKATTNTNSTVITELTSLVYVGIGITIIISVISLIISTLGGLLDRKESLQTLHLSGMTLRQMQKVVIIESLVPMILTTLISSALGIFSAAMMWSMSGSVSTTISKFAIYPGWNLLLIISISLLLATLAIRAVLPSIRTLVAFEGSRKE